MILSDEGPRTIVITLGAETFPEAKSLPGSEAFRNADQAFSEYMLSPEGFNVPFNNFLSFFDSEYEPDRLDIAITSFIEQASLQIKQTGAPVRNLFIHYVGHGIFDEHHIYSLALRSTREKNRSFSALRLNAFITTINSLSGDLRKFIIIDACFSGEALRYAQSSSIEETLKREIEKSPNIGTAYFCSSSADRVSRINPDKKTTVFSRALISALWEGTDSNANKLLSLNEICSITRNYISIHEEGQSVVLPEVHSPNWSKGNIADDRIFLNNPKSAITKREEEHNRERAARRQAIEQQRALKATELEREREHERRKEQEIRRKFEEEWRIRDEQRKTEEQRKKVEIETSGFTAEELVLQKEAKKLVTDEIDHTKLVAWLRMLASQHDAHLGSLSQYLENLRKQHINQKQESDGWWEDYMAHSKAGRQSIADIKKERWLQEHDKLRSLNKLISDCQHLMRIESLKFKNITNMFENIDRLKIMMNDSRRVSIAGPAGTWESYFEELQKRAVKKLEQRIIIEKLISKLWRTTRIVIVVVVIIFMLFFIGTFRG